MQIKKIDSNKITRKGGAQCLNQDQHLLSLSLSLLITLCSNLISLSPSFSQAETEEETITITTYYPAPFGVYNEMRAKKMAIGDNYYNGSQYCWPPATCSNPQIDGISSPCWPNCNTDLVVQGNVGIGTTQPQAKLDVDGGINATGKIKLGDDTSTPTAGAIRWTGTDFEGYNGTEWKSLTASSVESGSPFYGTAHTKEQCQAAGGTVTDYQANSFCKFQASSCPSGWTRYENLGSTVTVTCSGSSLGEGCPGTACSTANHNFGNIPTEVCDYGDSAAAGESCYVIYPYTCFANIIEVGCY